MDRQVVGVEGIMVTGNLHPSFSGYKLRVNIDIYGPPASRQALAPHLAWAGTISPTGLPPVETESATQVRGTSGSPKKGKGRQKAAEETEAEKEARKIMEGLKDLDKGEGKNDKILNELTKGIDVLKLPMHPDPPSRRKGQLKNDLLPHQSQGLLWMQQRENPELPKDDVGHVQLWQLKTQPQRYWLNIATKQPQAVKNPPELGKYALFPAIRMTADLRRRAWRHYGG